MSQTKISPTLNLVADAKHESHSFWFEDMKASVKVDRRKDGGGLAITLKTPESKVVISVGPQNFPRFVTEIKHSKQLNQGCEYSTEVSKDGVKLRLDYEPPTPAQK